MKRSALVFATLVTLHASLVPTPAHAVRQPELDGLAARQFLKPELVLSTTPVSVSGLPGDSAVSASSDLASMGLAGTVAYVDERSARWSSLFPSEPMLPGRGNSLTWGALGQTARPDAAALRELAWSRLSEWIVRNQSALRLDPAEFGTPKITVHRDGALVQVWIPRQVAGIPVRGNTVTAVINNGNLSLLGTSDWADVDAAALPELTVDRAAAVLSRHVAPFVPENAVGKAQLEFVPLAVSEDPKDRPVGLGIEYRLAWVLTPRFAGPHAEWEALVDAHDGELLSFWDKTNYASTRNVIGGVYPLANDGLNPDGFPESDGVLQTYPLPFADMTVGAVTYAGDSGGNLAACVDGNVSTTLSGPYIDITDVCGATNESTAGNTLDLAGTPGTTPHDCAVPAGGHSAGDTASARSAFYEINKIAEMGRGHLPENTWLQKPLPVQVNIAQQCNATGGPGGLRFYRSGGGCTNTGEIAGVFDHEWGHGMDGSDAAPGISNPGEGIADTYAALRLNTSCIGRNFLLSSPCGGYGDPCVDPDGGGPLLACSGVRDIDFDNRQSGNPHDVDWANANCGNSGGSPCGGGVHCEGAIYAEAIWDLWHRDLTAVPFSMSIDTAREVATRLTFTGGQLVGSWYTCGATGCPSGFCGCNANGGYLNYIAADDDNGNLNDGTPHMDAIFDAFDRHQLACATPTVQTAGCAGAPTVAPVVSTTPFDRGATVTWGTVAGATSYRVYRTEGVAGCDFGKTLIGETAGLSWTDGDGLMNGRTYNYMVIAMGNGDTCFGPASACSAVTPAAGANVAFRVQPKLQILSGDSDGVLDNCEAGRVYFSVDNIGAGTLTNVRVADARSPTHPAIDANVSFPSSFAPSLAACGTALGVFDFVAAGLSENDVVQFEVEVTADEISPRTVTAQVEVGAAETSFTLTASQVYDFEADTNGWTVVAGTFNRTAGGAPASPGFSERSSAALNDRCDRIQSPLIQIHPTSTLTLSNNYQIEPQSGGTWYDRANVSLERNTGEHTVVSPTGGRLYNAAPGGPGSYSGCNPEVGWAGTQNTWGTSTWSAANFGGAVPAGSVANLMVTYSTDPLESLAGFWFDHVTLTDVGIGGPDAQDDSCVANSFIFGDGYETGNTVFWSSTTP